MLGLSSSQDFENTYTCCYFMWQGSKSPSVLFSRLCSRLISSKNNTNTAIDYETRYGIRYYERMLTMWRLDAMFLPPAVLWNDEQHISPNPSFFAAINETRGDDCPPLQPLALGIVPIGIWSNQLEVQSSTAAVALDIWYSGLDFQVQIIRVSHYLCRVHSLVEKISLPLQYFKQMQPNTTRMWP